MHPGKRFRSAGTRRAADILDRFLATEMDVQRIRLGDCQAGARDMARRMQVVSRAMGRPVMVVKDYLSGAVYLIRTDIEDWTDWRNGDKEA